MSARERAARRTIPLLREHFDPAAARASTLGATCRRGCTSCCYKLVDASLAEGALIALYVTESAQFRGRVRAIREHLRQQLSDAVLSREAEYFAKQIPCAFLDVASGDCTIYPVRPGSCRGHYVVSRPSQCSFANGVQTIAFVNTRDLYFRFMRSLVETMPTPLAEFGSLQAMTLAGFAYFERAPAAFTAYLAAVPRYPPVV